MTKIQPKIARSGDGAEYLTFFSIFWNGFVCLFYFLKPHDHIWLQLIFLGIGIFLIILTIYTWRQRIQGGKVELHLSMNPVPHGITVTSNFELSNLIQANSWSIEARFEQWILHSGQKSYHAVWRQTFPASVIDRNQITAKFAFPNDYSQNNYEKFGKSSTLYQRILTLKADQLSWEFLLDTRDANIEESILESQTSLTLGNNAF